MVLLGLSSPGSWSELILILSKRVVESSQVRNSLPGSDEFNHLSPLGDVDRSGLVIVIVLWKRDSNNFL